jgi:hypothetical protein
MMATGDGKESGAGKPRAGADEDSLELSSRGNVVIRSSSHPPGTRPPTSSAPAEPGSTPPAGRPKRNTPAQRPRGRRAVQGIDGEHDLLGTPSSVPPPAADASEGSSRALWVVLLLGAIVAAVVSYFAGR